MILGAPECAFVVGGRAIATTGPSTLSSRSFHVLPTYPSSSFPGDPENPGPYSTWSQHYGLVPGSLPSINHLHISKDKGPRGKEGLTHHLIQWQTVVWVGKKDSKGTRHRPRVPPLDPSDTA